MATMGSLTTYAALSLLQWVFNRTPYPPPDVIYAGLFTSAPDDSGGGTEFSVAPYARMPVSFTRADGDSPRMAENIEQLTFSGVTETATHIGLFDASTGGNLLWYGEADGAVAPTPDGIDVMSGALMVTIIGMMTEYLANALLNHMLRAEAYEAPTYTDVALYDPDDNETTGAGYERITVPFAVAVLEGLARATNPTEFEFTDLPAADYVAAKVHEDEATGGEALWEWTYPLLALTSAGGKLTVPANTAVATLT